MRVRCERLLKTFSDDRGAPREPLPAPARDFPVVGREYAMLAILVEAKPPRGLMPVGLLLLDEGRAPSWVPAAMFSVTSDALPSTWAAKLSDTGELELAPAPWLRDGFWAELHGGDQQVALRAREVFEREAALIEREDPLPQ